MKWLMSTAADDGVDMHSFQNIYSFSCRAFSIAKKTVIHYCFLCGIFFKSRKSILLSNVTSVALMFPLGVLFGWSLDSGKNNAVKNSPESVDQGSSASYVSKLEYFEFGLKHLSAGTSVTSITENSLDKTLSLPVQTLLAEAEKAMLRNAYTTPLDSNAFSLYRSVLLLDSENEHAKLGVERIRLAYTSLLEKANNEGDQARLRSFYFRAQDVGVDKATLASYENKVVPLNAKHSEGISIVTRSNEVDHQQSSLSKLRELGKVYQSQKQYLHAIPVYQEIVKLSKTDSSDWLGLAVSLDSEGRAVRAVEAYKRVVRLSHSNPKVVDYSRQRIDELSGTF